MNNGKALEQKLYSFFFTYISEGLQTKEINEPGVSQHVAQILVRFTNTRNLKALKNRVIAKYKENGEISPSYIEILEELKHVYIEDLERSYLGHNRSFNEQQSFFGHKLIGDYALFMVGMFPDFLEQRKLPSFNKTYFIDRGTTHYSQASALLEPAMSVFNGNIFETLAERFADIADTIDSFNSANWDSDRVKQNEVLEKFKKYFN